MPSEVIGVLFMVATTVSIGFVCFTLPSGMLAEDGATEATVGANHVTGGHLARWCPPPILRHRWLANGTVEAYTTPDPSIHIDGCPDAPPEPAPPPRPAPRPVSGNVTSCASAPKSSPLSPVVSSPPC